MTESKIVTANALEHGGVVFLTSDGGWTGDINQAAIAGDDAQINLLLEIAGKSENKTRVVEPYAIDVRRVDGLTHPLRLRERIRAVGPTVRADLLKSELYLSGSAGV